MSKRENLYVDIHVIQTVPPSCVNRDDTGSPKSSLYGGVRRARVSSQAWKRAVRCAFREMYEPEDLAYRTKNIVEMVEQKILALDSSLNAQKLAIDVLKIAGFKINEKKPEKGMDVLFFISHAQAMALAEIAVSDVSEKDKTELCKSALKDNPSIDMALFGRMVASDPSLNYDAAAMVAHSISTHKVQTEYDYFTAVDDCSQEDNAGAGHLGTIEYNSATLYRYASINVKELSQSLGDATAKSVGNFIKAFILSMPTGKITTFANRTVPDAVYITIRNDQPVNMSPAFEKPVNPDSDGGYVAESKKALINYTKNIYSSFVSEPSMAWTVGDGMDEIGTKTTMKNMLENIEEHIANMI